MDMLNVIMCSFSTRVTRYTHHTDVYLSIKTTLNYPDVSAERCAFRHLALYKKDANLMTLDWRFYCLTQNNICFQGRAMWKSIYIYNEKIIYFYIKQKSKNVKKLLSDLFLFDAAQMHIAVKARFLWCRMFKKQTFGRFVLSKFAHPSFDEPEVALASIDCHNKWQNYILLNRIGTS